MDPSSVNVFIAFSLTILTVTALLLIGSVIPLFMQAGRTLNAYEKLADTMQNELRPTLTEVRTMLEGVNELRSVTADRVTQVGHKVEDVAGTIGVTAGQAKKQSSVWGAGLIAGVKAYLIGDSNHASQAANKQIAENRGTENVELNQ